MGSHSKAGIDLERWASEAGYGKDGGEVVYTKSPMWKYVFRPPNSQYSIYSSHQGPHKSMYQECARNSTKSRHYFADAPIARVICIEPLASQLIKRFSMAWQRRRKWPNGISLGRSGKLLKNMSSCLNAARFSAGRDSRWFRGRRHRFAMHTIIKTTQVLKN